MTHYTGHSIETSKEAIRRGTYFDCDPCRDRDPALHEVATLRVLRDGILLEDCCEQCARDRWGR